MPNRIVAALIMVMVAGSAAATESRPWNLDGSMSAPVPDEERSGHWWWPAKPSGDAARSAVWGNRGVVYRNLPPAEDAKPSLVQPPPPPPIPWTTAHPTVVLNNVLFQRDSAKIEPGNHGAEAVDELIAYMEKHPYDTFVLEGHTCDIGSEAYNLALGQRRADAVKDYMLANGIDPSRVSTASHGLTRPAVPNDSDNHRALNRRVVFMFKFVHVD